MKKNMGFLDRLLRSLAAGIIAWLCYAGILTGLTSITLLVVAAVLLMTSVFGNCPLYSLLGISSKAAPKSSTHG